MDMQKAAFAIAGVATAYSVFASVRLIRSHLANWTKPQQQKHIVAIIAMAPLFAVDSYIGLLDMDASETFVMFLDAIKECYEAFVIMSFLRLMFEYLNVEFATVPAELKGTTIHHTPPFNYFMKDFNLDSGSVKMLYNWTLQFLVLRPVLSILSLVLDVNDAYEAWATPISVVLNVSVTVAVTALITFYHAFEHELSPHKPLAQFLCIKGVVFFAFWQGVVLSVLVKFGVVHGSHWYTTEEIDEGIQNFLVCLEMGALFSFAHDYAFAATEFKAGYVQPPLPPKKADAHHKAH